MSRTVSGLNGVHVPGNKTCAHCLKKDIIQLFCTRHVEKVASRRQLGYVGSFHIIHNYRLEIMITTTIIMILFLQCYCKHMRKQQRTSKLTLRGRSQLSTFMKAYTAYARGRGSIRFFPRKSNSNFNHRQCIIKYAKCLESGQYAHICRSLLYNITFEALFLMSKCTQSDFLWTQTVAPHHAFSMAAQRRFRSAYSDYSSQIAPNRE